MTHLDEGALQAFLDDELARERRAEVEGHLAGCDACRAELEALRAGAAGLTAALGLLERPLPAAHRYVIGTPRRPGAPRPAWALPRAAVLLLGFAAAASATIPGSPVRRWVEQVLAPREAGVAAAPTPRAAPPAPAQGAERAVTATRAAAPEAGVSVRPEAGQVSIELRRAAPGLRVRATLTDGERAGVFATGPAADARFTTAPGRIEVTGAEAGELRIELPRGAAATVEVDGERYLAKEGENLRLSLPAEDSSAAEVVFRIP